MKTNTNNNKYYMVRTYSAGVFAGRIVKREGKECEMTDARRIWYWDGAFTLSGLAENGTSKPQECKFAIPVKKVILTEVIEIIEMTEKAKKSVYGVKNYEPQIKKIR